MIEENWASFHRKHRSPGVDQSQEGYNSYFSRSRSSRKRKYNATNSMICVFSCILKPFSNPHNTLQSKKRQKKDKERELSCHITDHSMNIQQAYNQNEGLWDDDNYSNNSIEFGYTFPSDRLHVQPNTDQLYFYSTMNSLE